MFKRVRTQIWKVIVAQSAVPVLIGMVWTAADHWQSGVAAILGGAACVLPSIYFVRKLFSDKIRSPRRVVLDFYVAELVKLIVSVVLLVLIFRFLPVKLLPLLSGYIGAYLAVWLAPVIVK